MEEQLIKFITENFDFIYMFNINILTYVIINIIDAANGKAVVKMWQKRIVLLISIIVLSLIYYNTNQLPLNIIINSSITAPVFWSWILKPMCIKLNIDYKKVDDTLK